MTNQTIKPKGAGTQTKEQLPIKVKYCLCARKSTESDEFQALSIDFQIKEMPQLAERKKIEVREIPKRASAISKIQL
jgi:hypothetical protein